MKKNIKIIIGVLLGLIVIVLLCYKLFVVLIYKESMDIDAFNNFIEEINLNDVENIETEYYEEDEYISYNGLSFYSSYDFEDFTESDNSITYVEYDEDGVNINKSISITGADEILINSYKSQENGTNLEKFIDFYGVEDFNEFLDTNNITNDIEFYDFIKDYEINNPTLFSSFYEMRVDYRISNFISTVIVYDSIYRISNNYEGIIFEQVLENRLLYTIFISKEDKNYIVSLIINNSDDSTTLNEILSSIIID